MSAFVLAGSCPSSPVVVYTGNIIYDDEILIKDYDLVANVAGNIVFGEVNNGAYEIDVSSCMAVSSGKVSFSINGEEADERPDWNGQEDWGKTIELDLNFDNIPPSNSPCGNGEIDPGEQCDGADIGTATCQNVVGEGWDGSVTCTAVCTFEISGCYYHCGNGVCDSEETCSSCSNDCGSCPATSTGGSSGSGGGSGGGSSGGGGGSVVPIDTVSTSEVNDNDNDNSGAIGTKSNFKVKEEKDLTNTVVSPLAQTNENAVKRNSLTGAIVTMFNDDKAAFGGVILAVVVVLVGVGTVVLSLRKKKRT